VLQRLGTGLWGASGNRALNLGQQRIHCTLGHSDRRTHQHRDHSFHVTQINSGRLYRADQTNRRTGRSASWPEQTAAGSVITSRAVATVDDRFEMLRVVESPRTLCGHIKLLISCPGGQLVLLRGPPINHRESLRTRAWLFPGACAEPTNGLVSRPSRIACCGQPRLDSDAASMVWMAYRRAPS
jgi:hypothetical protein